MKDAFDPFLQHILRNLASEAKGAPARTEGQAVLAVEPAAPEGDVFPMTQLRDRVVIMLLFNQLVRVEQVQRASQRWQERQHQGDDGTLWRVLAEDPELDRDAIFYEAAQLYSFDEIVIGRRAAATVIARVAGQLTDAQRAQMVALGIVPVAIEEDRDGERRLTFATHDPARSEVLRLVEQVAAQTRHRYELRYAPEAEVAALIHRAFSKEDEQEYVLARLNVPEEVLQAPPLFDGQGEAPAPPAITEAATLASSTEVSRGVLIQLFEEALVAAVQKRASQVILFPNASRQTEIMLRMDRHLVRWHVEDRIGPEVFAAAIRGWIKKTGGFAPEGTSSETIQRWIDQVRVRFRVSVYPVSNAEGKREADQVVITIVDDRWG